MKFITAILALLVSGEPFAQAGLKLCNFGLTNAEKVVLSHGEPTDMRVFPEEALREVFHSLKGKYIQVTIRENIPTLVNYGREQTVLMRVLGTNRETIKGQRVPVLVGTTTGFYGHGSFEEGTDETLLHKSIVFDDIVSLRLIELEEVQVELKRIYKPDGRPHLTYSMNLEDKIKVMSEGDADAAIVLGKILAAPLPKINEEEVTFDGLLKVLVRENIRGRQIVALYEEFAGGNIDKLVNGVYLQPEQVAQTVNKAMMVIGNQYRHAALNPWFLTSDNKPTK